MATNEEVLRLIMETIGTQGVEDLRRKLSELPNEMGKVAAAFGRGEVSAEEFDREVKRLRESHIQLTRTITDFDKVAGGASNKMAGFGQSSLQAGRAIQDFQAAGLMGVINNVEGLAMALGGGPGLAGVLTLLGVGFITLKGPITEFIDSLRTKDVEQFRDAMARLKDELKKLEEKPAKLAVDFRDIDIAKGKIDELQQAQNSFDKLGRGQDPFERESGQQVEELFATLGMAESEAVKNRLKGQEYERLRAADPTIQGIAQAEARAEEEVAQAERLRAAAVSADEIRLAISAIETARKTLDDAREAARNQERNLQTQAEQDVGRVFGGATRGDVRQQQELVNRLRGIGQAGLAGSVEAVSPASIQAEEEAEAKFNRDIEARKEAIARRDARAKTAQQAREKAGRAAEQALAADPLDKIRRAENFERFGAAGLGLDANAAALEAQNAREVREQREAKERRAGKLGDVPSREQQRRAQEERLATQIFHASPQVTGGYQFTPEQSREAAQRTMEMQRQGLDANRAALAAMGQVMQTTLQMTNEARQLQAWAMQMGRQFNQMYRQMQMPGPTNLNMGGP